MIVTFEDPEVPISVQRVTNETIRELVGYGYRIERAEIEYSEAEVTRTGEIFEWLPWLRGWPPVALDGNKYHSTNAAFPLANSLTMSSFQGRNDLRLSR